MEYVWALLLTLFALLIWGVVAIVRMIRHKKTNYYEINVYYNWSKKNKKGGEK